MKLHRFEIFFEFDVTHWSLPVLAYTQSKELDYWRWQVSLIVGRLVVGLST